MYSACIVPYDGMVITQDTVFCEGDYYLPNGIIINASNVVLDCDGANLTGEYSGYSKGISVDHIENVTIENCKINDYYYGIYFNYADDSRAINNTVYDTSQNIYAIRTNRCRINSNWLYGSYEGLYLSNSDYCDVKNNNVFDNRDDGVHLYYSDHNNIHNNNISFNERNGIYDHGGYYNNHENNLLQGNRLTLYWANYATLSGNVIVDSTLYVVNKYYHYIDDSNTIDGKPIYYYYNEQNKIVPTDAGYVALIKSRNITVSDIELSNRNYGILLVETEDSKIENLILSDNSYGIVSRNSNNNILTGNTIKNSSGFGIKLSDSYNNKLTNNNISISNRGIYLTSSDYNNLSNNLIRESDSRGISFSSSNYNILKDNNLNANSRSLYFSSNDDYYQYIDDSNMVNGKPVYFYFNEHNKKVPLDAGYIAAVNSSNITISDISISNENEGVLLYKTINSKISRLNLSFNTYGIRVIESSNNTILNNTLNNNGFGIRLTYSDNNQVLSNSISDGGEGIDLYKSHNNELRDSFIDSNNIGFSMHCSDNNSILNNQISDNDDGFNLYCTQPGYKDNVIEYNTILDNKINFKNKYEDNVSAKNNWWGETNKDMIKSIIYDYYDDSNYGIVDYEPYLYGPFDGNQMPVINNLKCRNSSSWEECDNLGYSGTLTKVRVNCTDRDGTITEARFELKNLQNQLLFNETGSYGSGYWTYDNNDLLLDYEGLTLSATCIDNSSEENGLSQSWLLGKDLIFYESFEDVSSITNNNGTITGSPTFTKGVLGNAVNFSGSKRACYPLANNFNEKNGTVEFWVKPPMGGGYGFFDIGNLGPPNTWGLYKNSGYLILEMKTQSGSWPQSWSPNPFNYDGRWHHAAAMWERQGNIRRFKVCLSGECKNYYDQSSNSNTSELTTFCVGYSGWYGYSESIMDEFKIFNYAKSNEEIEQDYLALVNNTIENGTKKECIRYKPESKGPVKINCSGLYVNNKSFTAKGVGYQAIPIGKTAESLQDKQYMYDDVGIRQRDFPLLREMNANTIRTWAEVMSESWMDDLYNNGEDPIYVLMGFWINCNENYGDPTIRQGYIDKFTDYVTTYKDHPAVLAWALGNENNLGYCISSSYIDDFYSLGNELARIAYEIEGENYHPVGIVNGDLGYIGFSEYNADDASLNYTDFWGSNVYPGKTFGDWFDDYAALSGKPLFITEYGIDAWNHSNNQEQEGAQAEWVLNQWNDINNADMTIGSALMAYSDEWWKGGSYGCDNKYTHGYCGYSTTKHPDGYSNEEWWGVMRTVDNGANPDIMQPRQVYYALQEAFAEVSINIPLNQGWNLLSIPLILDDNSVASVFTGLSYSKLFYYDSAWKVPTEIDNTKGYWIKMNNAATLTVEGLPPESTPPSLNTGWNLIGHHLLEEIDIIGDIFENDTIYTYDGTWSSYIPGRTFNSLTTFEPGYGYWVKIE